MYVEIGAIALDTALSDSLVRLIDKVFDLSSGTRGTRKHFQEWRELPNNERIIENEKTYGVDSS